MKLKIYKQVPNPTNNSQIKKSTFPGPAFFSVEKEDVQEQDTDEVEENEVPIESFFLDMEYIKMINSINELITTHPFILQTVVFFMNIVKWFQGNPSTVDNHNQES